MAEVEINKQEKETKKAGDKTEDFSPGGKANNQSADTGKNVGNQKDVGENVKEAVNNAKESASGIAGKVYEAATEKAASVIDEQKSSLAEDLSNFAENIRQMGNNAGGEQAKGFAGATSQYSNTIADSIQKVSDYVEQKNLSDVMGDVEKLAHRNPGLFLGGAFALGFLAVRFIKSSPNQDSARSFRGNKRKSLREDEKDGVHLPRNLDEIANSAERRAEQANKSATETGDSKSANAAASNKGG